MSGYGYNGIDDEDEDDFQPGQGDGPAGLRAAHRKLEKEVAKLRKELEERDAKIADLSTKSRSQSLAEILRSKQVNPKLANLIPASVEASEEAVGQFLEEYKELFPVSAPKAPEHQPPADDAHQGDDEFGDEELDDEALALQQSYADAQAALRGARPQIDAKDTSKKLGEVGETAKSFDDAVAQLSKIPGFNVGAYKG